MEMFALYPPAIRETMARQALVGRPVIVAMGERGCKYRLDADVARTLAVVLGSQVLFVDADA